MNTDRIIWNSHTLTLYIHLFIYTSVYIVALYYVVNMLHRHMNFVVLYVSIVLLSNTVQLNPSPIFLLIPFEAYLYGLISKHPGSVEDCIGVICTLSR